MAHQSIFLASNSPRRRELLEQIGVRFSVLKLSIPENRLENETPENYVKRMAIEKASAGIKVLQQRDLKSQKNTLSDWQSTKKHATIGIVIGSDTAVVCDGEILGKPESPEQAELMLERLSASTHEVFTGVAVSKHTGTGTNEGCQVLSAVSRNLVTFRKIRAEEIKAYVATNEGADKAGSYAIQGLAAIFIEQLQGSYSAVMGLPLFETASLLEQSGIDVLPKISSI